MATEPAPTAYRASIPEKQLLADVLQLARLLHWRAFHPWLSVKSEAGYPDLTLLRVRPGAPPRLLFAELKSARGVLTDHQRDWLLDLAAIEDHLIALGGDPAVTVHLWTPETWHSGEIERVLKGQ